MDDKIWQKKNGLWTSDFIGFYSLQNINEWNFFFVHFSGVYERAYFEYVYCCCFGGICECVYGCVNVEEMEHHTILSHLFKRQRVYVLFMWTPRFFLPIFRCFFFAVNVDNYQSHFQNGNVIFSAISPIFFSRGVAFSLFLGDHKWNNPNK